MSESLIRHSGLVARRVDGFWLGALIEGPSGSGKSDLALRALGLGFRLVADDRTVIFASAGRLFGRAPAPLAGLIEARAFDVVAVAPILLAQIVLYVRCAGKDEIIPRLADEAAVTLCGVAMPGLVLAGLEASAADKLRFAVECLGARRQAGYQAPRSRAPDPCARGRAQGL